MNSVQYQDDLNYKAISYSHRRLESKEIWATAMKPPSEFLKSCPIFLKKSFHLIENHLLENVKT